MIIENQEKVKIRVVSRDGETLFLDDRGFVLPLKLVDFEYIAGGTPKIIVEIYNFSVQTAFPSGITKNSIYVNSTNASVS